MRTVVDIEYGHYFAQKATFADFPLIPICKVEFRATKDPSLYMLSFMKDERGIFTER